MKHTTRISIIIPVLREAGTIRDCLRRLQDLPFSGKKEIIVVDGDPEGSTLRALEDKDVVKVTSPPGRGTQMNRGAGLASGEILLFLHADTLLPPQGLARIAGTMAGGQYVGGAFDLGFETDRKIFSITERYVALRTRLTRVPFGDQAIFLRTDHFRAIGGFRDIPLMEDVELMQRIRRRGDRICIIPEKVMTSPRRYEQEGVLYATIRNISLQVLYALGVPPERLAQWYRPNQP